MRTAILSDIHGNDVAFEAVVQDMNHQNINNIIFLGDLVAKGPQPKEVFERMMALKPLVWLKGNTDAWLDDAMIDILPTTKKEILLLAYYDYMAHRLEGSEMDALIAQKKMSHLHIEHYDILCVHGSPLGMDDGMDPLEKPEKLERQLKYSEEGVVLFGHTHKQISHRYHVHRLINPGAVGVCNHKNDTRAAYAIMDTNTGFNVELRQVAYDLDLVYKIASERSFPNMEDYRNLLTVNEG
ncbi:metallophosphoesterase family protein [Petrocella sp. FN5]|uniref:metallophosphoesterase family protein n=1 Tax=Petrocella sp. FN5 TaxID=3032002 RepID=UPI0023D9C364|nr:YfcE family phosphodiesterase [Petrocella sp. FN5]MDF1616423.1 YfcE family phosphodiesterase [Petrocella sp. FN5]